MLPIAATIIRIERIFGTICNIGKKINVTKKNEYYIRHAYNDVGPCKCNFTKS